MEDRIVSEENKVEEHELQNSLRPKTLKEYIGQEKLKEGLNISIAAAKMRNEAMDHILFYGAPGLGKTTLAGVIANEMGVNLKITSGPVLEKAGDLAAILTSLEEDDILFIDEIHRLNTNVEEILYPAMEDGELDIIIGKGPSARSIRISLPPFTLIGATTRAGLLSAPLRDRFGMIYRMDHYTIVEMIKIVERGSGIFGVEIDREGASEIASRSRGTPRICNRLLKRVRDYVQIKEDGEINRASATSALNLLDVDIEGLDELDREILKGIILKYNGGPVGIGTLALMLGEDRKTLEEVYEPFLVKKGFIKRTHRGRVATELAYKHIGIDFNREQEYINNENNSKN